MPNGDMQKIRSRLRSYERKLQKEKEEHGCYRDGAGKRYQIGPHYTPASLPPLLRRVGLLVWFVIFYWLLFFFLPSLFIEWNAELGWPVWRSGPTGALGALMVVGGVGVIMHCTGLFAFIGRGTPVPVAPPENLVIRGLYRYSRNPIYVANIVVWLGIFLWEGHVALLLLTVMAITVTELVIVLSEEPGLRKRFGSDYEGYCARVPRWLPLRPAPR